MHSSTWKGGVAFIEPKVGDINCKKEGEEEVGTWVRLYLITAQQFHDVVDQENCALKINLNLNKAKKVGTAKVCNGWYDTVLYLNEHEGHPVFTFTSGSMLEENKPSKAYLHIIITGLKQMRLSQEQIVEYLSQQDGVMGHWKAEALTSLVSSCFEMMK